MILEIWLGVKVSKQSKILPTPYAPSITIDCRNTLMPMPITELTFPSTFSQSNPDAAKFGHTYLAKLGWNPTLGHGLGVAKDGRTTNIAVAQKLDQLGIGAGRGAGGANDKDGVAWKQQNDFEMMLARLNQQTIEGTTEGEVKEGVVAALGFVASSSAPQDLAGFEVAEASASSSSSKKEKKDKKRKRSELETDEGLSKSTTSEATSSTTAAAAVLVAPAPRRFA